MKGVSLILAALLYGTTAMAASSLAEPSNHFASIYIDDDKSGQAHFTVIPNKNGDSEQLKTNVSVSILGIDVFHLNQNLHEEWANGELQLLRARTDDDGDEYAAIVKRQKDGYDAMLNGKPVDLPADAFPLSLWHFAITGSNTWFDPKDLKVRQVVLHKTADNLDLKSGAVKTQRFDVSGDWKGTLWYDENNKLVQVDQSIKDHNVRMVIDP